VTRSVNLAPNSEHYIADSLDYEADRGQEKGNSNEEEADDRVYLEAWACVCDGLEDNKIQELDLSIQPARLMLAKVCPSL